MDNLIVLLGTVLMEGHLINYKVGRIKITPNTNSKNHQLGVYFVLISFALVMFLGFCALVVGLGGVYGQKQKLQNLANLASLAAIHGFANENGDFDAKKTKANERANLILSQNSITGTLNDTELVGASVELGIWYRENVAGNPCGLPFKECFVVVSSSGGYQTGPGMINSARVQVRNKIANPIQGIFTSFFNKQNFSASATGVSVARPRCNVFILDLSLASTWLTHDPRVVGGSQYYAFESPTGSVCASPPNPAYTAYCAYAATRNVVAPTTLFQSDYQNAQTWRETASIPIKLSTLHNTGGYVGPQPFTSMIWSVNGAIRQIAHEQVFGDTSTILGCTDGVVTTVGPTTQHGYLSQVTDYEKNNPLRSWSSGPGYATESIGSYPNPLDVGLIPVAPNTVDPAMPYYQKKDLCSCIKRADSILASSCPVGAIKNVFMLSDGVSNAYPPDPALPCSTVEGSTCGYVYNSLLDCRNYASSMSSKYHFYGATFLPFIVAYLSDIDVSLPDHVLRIFNLTRLTGRASATWNTWYEYIINKAGLSTLAVDVTTGYSDLTTRPTTAFGFLIAWAHAYIAGQRYGDYLPLCNQGVSGNYTNGTLTTATHGDQLNTCTVNGTYAQNWLHDMTRELAPVYEIKGE